MMNINCKKTETEQKKLKKLITDKAKEIENEKNFVINNKYDRKLIEKKSDYEYKTEEKLASIFVPKIREKDKIEKDLLLKSSVTSIEESQNARKILENVFKKVESTKLFIQIIYKECQKLQKETLRMVISFLHMKASLKKLEI
jgi:hypothetical protein